MGAWRTHVGWGFALSLALHLVAIAALAWALPLLHVRPGTPHRIELAIVHEPAQQAPPPAAVDLAAQSAQAAEPSTADMPKEPVWPEPARRKVRVARKPQAAPNSGEAPRISSAQLADSRSDGSVLERVLRKIAATSELTQDERRKAMLLVLRTWEDPSGSQDAQRLVDALLANLQAADPLDSSSPADTAAH